MTEDIDLLISGATLVTMNAERLMIRDGSVAVKDGKILDVGKASKIDRE